RYCPFVHTSRKQRPAWQPRAVRCSALSVFRRQTRWTPEISTTAALSNQQCICMTKRARKSQDFTLFALVSFTSPNLESQPDRQSRVQRRRHHRGTKQPAPFFLRQIAAQRCARTGPQADARQVDGAEYQAVQGNGQPHRLQCRQEG